MFSCCLGLVLIATTPRSITFQFHSQDDVALCCERIFNQKDFIKHYKLSHPHSQRSKRKQKLGELGVGCMIVIQRKIVLRYILNLGQSSFKYQSNGVDHDEKCNVIFLLFIMSRYHWGIIY